jgi:hypothetical protein
MAVKTQLDLFAGGYEFIGFVLIRKQPGLRVRDEFASAFCYMCVDGAFHHVCLPPKRNTSIHKLKKSISGLVIPNSCEDACPIPSKNERLRKCRSRSVGPKGATETGFIETFRLRTTPNPCMPVHIGRLR